MEIIGLDIHSGKQSYILKSSTGYEVANPIKFKATLYEYLKCKDGKTLIVCDAPISIPYNYHYKKGVKGDNPFTKRGIEYFFSKNINIDHSWNYHVKDGRKRLLKGISIQGYGSMSQRTIVDHVFNISCRNPGVNDIDVYPIYSNEDFQKFRTDESTKVGLVEIHPTLYIWNLIFQNRPEYLSLEYKGNANKEVCRLLYLWLKKIMYNEPDAAPLLFSRIVNDDHLDCLICYYAGKMLIEGTSKIYGNKVCGSFVLPNNNNLEEDFERFVQSHYIED